MSLVNFDNWVCPKGKRIRNAFLLYWYVDKNGDVRFLVGTHRNGKVGLIGGEIEDGEHLFKAAQREFREETGQSAPRSYKNSRKSLVYNNHTIIFVARIAEKIQLGDPRKLGGDGEIIDLRFTKVDDLKKACAGSGNFQMRDCARRSLIMTIKKLKM